MFNARTGYLLGAAALFLLLSPEARKTVRKWAVKGTGTVLDLTDQAKQAGAGLQKQLVSLTESSRTLLPGQMHKPAVENVRNESNSKL